MRQQGRWYEEKFQRAHGDAHVFDSSIPTEEHE
jgi:hypothetical protein